MIAIFAIGIWAVVINNTSNEEFPVKTLEDQQKACVAFIRLISTLGVLDHCAICKYIYQNWMEGVQFIIQGLPHLNLGLNVVGLFDPLVAGTEELSD